MPLYRLQGVNFPELRAGGLREIVWEVSRAPLWTQPHPARPSRSSPGSPLPTLTPQVLDPRAL